MKVFPQVLTSASSGVYNWSEVLNIYYDVSYERFNLEWHIQTSATTIDFAWSGSSTSTGTFARSGILIHSGTTSGSGENGDGRDFSRFEPRIFPFVKIGAKATGTTSTISCSLLAF